MQSGAVKCQETGMGMGLGWWEGGCLGSGDPEKVYFILIYFFAGKLKWDLLRFGHSNS